MWIDRGVSRPTAWITIRFLYFEQNTHDNPLIKTTMYNACFSQLVCFAFMIPQTVTFGDFVQRCCNFLQVAHLDYTLQIS